MYVFLKEKMKYPAVCTEDRKHWLLVGCTPEMQQEFEKEYGLKRGETATYIAHHTDNPNNMSIICASLPQRLNPLFSANQMPYESFFSMHKYFYRDDLGNLAVDGTYFGVEGEENPFVKVTDKSKYICLKDVKLNA
jgi:hypothetical protein